MAPILFAATTETVELTIISLQPPPHLEQSCPQADWRFTATSAVPLPSRRVTFAVWIILYHLCSHSLVRETTILYSPTTPTSLLPSR